MRGGGKQINWTNPVPTLGLSWVQGSISLKAGIRAGEFMKILLRPTKFLMALSQMHGRLGKEKQSWEKTSPRHFRSLLNPLLQPSKNWGQRQYWDFWVKTVRTRAEKSELVTPQWPPKAHRSLIVQKVKNWETKHNFFCEASLMLRSYVMLKENSNPILNI